MAEGEVVNSETQGNEFVNSLPEDVRTADALPSLSKFKDVGSLAKSYLEAEKMISRKGVIVPTERSTPDEWNNYYKALGRPDSIDGYELKKPDSLPEGMTYNEERTKQFAELAHKIGLSKTAVQEIAKWWDEGQRAEFEKLGKDANDYLTKSTAEMKKEWGKDYDANLKKADSVIVPIFGEDFQKMLIDTGLNNHPAMVKGMFKISQALGEHQLTKGGDITTKDQYSKEGLVKMMNDPRYKSMDPLVSDEGYRKQVAEYAQKLTEQGTR